EPDSHRGWGLTVLRYHDKLSEDIRPAMTMLMMAVLFVLLIACANVANLMMARATARMRELGVRVALGASRARVARLLLCESLVIGVLGAGLGILIAYWGLDVTLAAIPIDLPYWMHFGIDGATLSFTIALAVVSAVLFGLAPVLQT